MKQFLYIRYGNPVTKQNGKHKHQRTVWHLFLHAKKWSAHLGCRKPCAMIISQFQTSVSPTICCSASNSLSMYFWMGSLKASCLGKNKKNEMQVQKIGKKISAQDTWSHTQCTYKWNWIDWRELLTVSSCRQHKWGLHLIKMRGNDTTRCVRFFSTLQTTLVTMNHKNHKM